MSSIKRAVFVLIAMALSAFTGAHFFGSSAATALPAPTTTFTVAPRYVAPDTLDITFANKAINGSWSVFREVRDNIVASRKFSDADDQRLRQVLGSSTYAWVAPNLRRLTTEGAEATGKYNADGVMAYALDGNLDIVANQLDVASTDCTQVTATVYLGDVQSPNKWIFTARPTAPTQYNESGFLVDWWNTAKGFTQGTTCPPAVTTTTTAVPAK